MVTSLLWYFCYSSTALNLFTSTHNALLYLTLQEPEQLESVLCKVKGKHTYACRSVVFLKQLLMDWICSSDYSGPALWPVPSGPGVPDQVLGHSGRNWQKNLDFGAREALQVRHHETHRNWYPTFVYMKMAQVIWGVKPVFDDTTMYICRKQRVHQSRGGSQASGDAAGLLPAGSRAWWVECQAEADQPRWQHLFWGLLPEWHFSTHQLTITVVSHCFCICKVGKPLACCLAIQLVRY